VLPLFVTIATRGDEDSRLRYLRSILKELKREEFARFTLFFDSTSTVQRVLDAADALERRGLPYELVFTESAPVGDLGPSLAALRFLEEVSVETDGLECDLATVAATWIRWDVPVHLQMPLSEARIDDLEAVAENALGRGFSSVRFQRLSPESKDLSDATYRELTSRLATMLQEGWNVAIGGCLPYCHTPLLFNACSGGVHACVIRKDGGVYACRFATKPLGMLDEAPLRWIWNASAVSDFQAGRGAKCDACPLFSACRSGCRGADVDDPLIKGFKSRQLTGAVPEQLTMDQDLRVRLRGRRCACPSGDLLVSGRRVMPIEPRWSWLMGHLEKGDLRLRDVRSSYADEGMSLVFNLYLDGFVRMEQS